MTGNTVTRRTAISGLFAGATAALTGAIALTSAPAHAADVRDYNGVAGPSNLMRGHTMAFQVYLPAVQRGTLLYNFRLALKTTDGKTLVNHDFQLQPGASTHVTVAFLQNGQLLVNGMPVKGVVIDLLVVIAIIAILIGLLLPAVQKVEATSTSFGPGRIPGDLSVDYTLPFIEQIK